MVDVQTQRAKVKLLFIITNKCVQIQCVPRNGCAVPLASVLFENDRKERYIVPKQ